MRGGRVLSASGKTSLQSTEKNLRQEEHEEWKRSTFDYLLSESERILLSQSGD